MTAIHSSDRAAWLEARREYIGASEVASLLGESPYTTREQVIMMKSGLAEEWACDEHATNSGLLEVAHVTLARVHRGWTLVEHQQLTPDSVCPKLAATPDFTFMTPWGEALYEAKCTRSIPPDAIKSRITKSGAVSTAAYLDGVPLMHQLQAQAQMACTGFQLSVVGVLHTNPLLAYRTYFVPRHDLVIARIRREVSKAWEEIESLRAGKVAL